MFGYLCNPTMVILSSTRSMSLSARLLPSVHITGFHGILFYVHQETNHIVLCAKEVETYSYARGSTALQGPGVGTTSGQDPNYAILGL